MTAPAIVPRHVAVVVPASNEEGNIAATLHSIAAARRHLPPHVSSSVIVVADACVDATAAIARRVCNDINDVVLVTDHCNVGAARRHGTDHALSAVPSEPRMVWIATTDADTLVGPDWFTTQLQLAGHGIVGVAGIVQLRGDATITLRHAFATSYQLAPDGTHDHVHGANMAMRGDAYLAAGGWRDLPTGEDHDLWHRLAAIGPVIQTTAMTVQTSARRRGRAPAGFADDMATLHGVGA